VALMKQARAFGVGVLVATQNPMDVDYRALGNAGVWCIGRLQTDADCARVLDGLASTGPNGLSTAELGKVVKNLAPRWFLMRDVHARVGTILLQPRWAMSLLRGPMTRTEIQKALAMRKAAAEPGKQESTIETIEPGRNNSAAAKPPVTEESGVCLL